MDLRTVELFVPELGDSLNALLYTEKSWAIYNGMKRKVEKACMLAGAHHIETFTRPVALEFHPRLGPKRRKFDCTNHICVVKAIEDCLVRASVLQDDTAEYVHRISICRPRRADDGIGGILVVIQELDEPVLGCQQGLDLQPEPAF